MRTGRTRTVAYWTTSKGNLRLFSSRNLRGKDGARIGKIHHKGCDW